MTEPYRKRLMVMLAAIAVLWVISGLQFYFMAMPHAPRSTLREAFQGPAISWLIWAALAPLISWLVGRFSLEGGRPLPILIHILASAVICLGAGATNFILYDLFYSLNMDAEAPYGARMTNTVINQITWRVIVYWVILSIGFAVDFHHRYQKQLVNSLRLETQLAQSQLQALRMQLHPHFLFNTLNSIMVLQMKDVEAAGRMIGLLGDFLRMTLDQSVPNEVPLSKELEFLRSYLEIEQVRFQSRLHTSFDIQPGTLDLKVPYLILQPIIENAIRHGLAPKAEPGLISISACRSNGRLRLVVRDNGKGIKMGDIREGIGLSSTRNRLEKLYGRYQSVELQNADEGGLIVTLTLPVRKAAEVDV